jgi:hypothetical protein
MSLHDSDGKVVTLQTMPLRDGDDGLELVTAVDGLGYRASVTRR